jgi:tetratricopeptide (TPR) repeat protein
MRSLTRVWSVAALLWLLFIASAAWADPFEAGRHRGRAREHLTRGNRLYGVRSFEAAIAEYKAGALVEPAPVFDYNFGQCFRQLGRYQEAVYYYQQFLSGGSPEGEVLGAVKGSSLR